MHCFYEQSPIHFVEKHNLDQKEQEGAARAAKGVLG